MTTDATREGASQEDSAAAGTEIQQPPADAGRGVPPGREIMSEILRSRREIIEQNIAEGLPPGPEGEEPPAQEPPPADGQAGEDGQQPPPAEQPAPVVLKDEDLVEATVDGQKKLLPWKDARRLIQKESAADARLREAAQERERIKQERAEWERQRAQSPQQPAQPASAQATPEGAPEGQDGETLDQKVERIANAVQFGDEDATKAAIREILTEQKGRGDATPEQIVEAAVKRVAMEQTQLTAVQAVAEAYPETVQDRYLRQIAAHRFNEIVTADREAGVQRPYAEYVMEAAKQAHEWKHGAGTAPNGNGQQPQPGVDGMAARLDLKRQTATPQPPASARATPALPPKPQSRSELIADMRKQRGLPDFGG